MWLVKFPSRPADCAAVFISLPISFLPSGALMSHVPDVAARSSPIIYGQVKRAVSAIHFFWTVTLEFLVIENWTKFVVCCLRGWIKCSFILVLDPLSDFQIRNSFPISLSVWRTMSPHFSFLLSSRARNPKCSANNHQTVRRRASGFSAPNSPVRNNKSSSVLDSSFAAWGRFLFAS